jgi:hypothetical protein
MLPNPVPPLPAELVESACILANRDRFLPLLPRGGTIVEVGVGLGHFSRKLIDACAPARFTAIDTFRLHELPNFWGHEPAHYFGKKTHAAWYRDSFAAEIQSARMHVMEGDSAAEMEKLDDSSVDVFYIDADHNYDSVKRDLDVAVRKIRPDGWLIINDYILVDGLGATEHMQNHGRAMQNYALQTNMYCDVVLRRADFVPNLHARLAALQVENALLRGSTSWRVTAPLRAVARKLK